MQEPEKREVLFAKISALQDAREIIQMRLYENNRPPSLLQSVVLILFGATLGAVAVFVFTDAVFFLFGFLMAFGVYGLWSSLVNKRYTEDMKKIDAKISKIRNDMYDEI
jgi:hypothetical protein